MNVKSRNFCGSMAGIFLLFNLGSISLPTENSGASGVVVNVARVITIPSAGFYVLAALYAHKQERGIKNYLQRQAEKHGKKQVAVESSLSEPS